MSQSKKSNLSLGRIFAIIGLYLVGLVVGVLILVWWAFSQDKSGDRSTWPPFFSFYQNEMCYRGSSTGSGCSIGGSGAYGFDDAAHLTTIQLMEKNQLVMVENDGHTISKVVGAVDYTKLKCDLISFSRENRRDLDLQTFVPQRGDILQCSFTVPLEKNIVPVSGVYEKLP